MRSPVSKRQKMMLVRKYINGYIYLSSKAMAKRNGFSHFIGVKIARACAQTKFFSCQINGIGAIMERHFKSFAVTRGR